MNQILVTIVVPVHNVEKYLDRCVESLVNQTYAHLEIILVDDCSPDRSPQMCDEWANKDRRIQVIHKKVNEGQGIARNNALDIARGKYICFFDSDDYVMPRTIELTLTAIEEEKADLAIFGLKNIDTSGVETSSFVPQVGKHTYRGTEVLNTFLPDFIAADPSGKVPRLFYMSSWLVLYSTEVLRKANWHFVSERKIISEDIYSLLNLMSNIESVTTVPEALYCYCCNETSFSRKYTPDRYGRIKSFYLHTFVLCNSKKYNAEVLHRISDPYLAYTIATLKQEARHNATLKERRRIIKSIICDDTLQNVLRQNRSDCVNTARKILFYLMRKKWFLPCFLLLRFKR